MYANIITQNGKLPFRPPVFHNHTFRKKLSKVGGKNVSEPAFAQGTERRKRTNVVLVAVEDGLVAADLLRDVGEGLYDAEAELLALHLARDGDVLDVSD